METSVGGTAVTVKVDEPVIPPSVAWILVVPAATAVASPLELIVAEAVVADDHATEFVRFCVELSLKVPVAENCCVLPTTIDGFTGVTAIDTSVGACIAGTARQWTTPEVASLITAIELGNFVPASSAMAAPLLVTPNCTSLHAAAYRALGNALFQMTGTVAGELANAALPCRARLTSVSGIARQCIVPAANPLLSTDIEPLASALIALVNPPAVGPWVSAVHAVV